MSSFDNGPPRLWTNERVPDDRWARKASLPAAAMTCFATRRFDVLVVGAGITGCAAAWHLTRAGATVAIVDRSSVGTEASGRNAGSLHGQIPQELFFGEGEAAARRFLPALSFLLGALERWQHLSEELGTDLEVATHGGLVLIDDPERMRRAERKVLLEAEVGLPSRLLDQKEVQAMAPWISDTVLGATFSPVEGKANPLLACPAFAAAATASGAVICADTAVQAVEADRYGVRCQTTAGSLEADHVLLTAGDGLRPLARQLGVDLPVTTEPVQVAVTEPVEPVVHHLIYHAGQRLTLKQATTGTLLIGGGWPARLEPGTGYPCVDLHSLRANLAVALRVAPFLADVLVLRSWAGIGNGTPDLLPLVGALPGAPRVLVGLFPYMGFTAGPLLGQVLADLLLGRPPAHEVGPFDASRFATH